MSTPLRHTTQSTQRIGPFVSVSDGYTPVTGVTLTGADQAELLKPAGTATVDLSAATWSPVSDCNGWYDLTLTTGHTDTLGPNTVVIQDESLVLPIFKQFQILDEDTYDGIYGTGNLDTNSLNAITTGDVGTVVSQSLDNLNNPSTGDIGTVVNDLINAYDSPTNSEMSAKFVEISGQNQTITTNLSTVGSDVLSVPDAVWTEIISDHIGADGSAATMLSGINQDTSTDLPNQVSGLNNISSGQVGSLLSDQFDTLNDISTGNVGTIVNQAFVAYSPATSTEVQTQTNEISGVINNLNNISTGDIGVIITDNVPTAQDVAWNVLTGRVNDIEDDASEYTLATLILGQLETVATGTTLTIYQTDGTTVHITKTIATNSGAAPIVSIT